jgi:peptidoglycan hydrolase-like protein with peptidoglycan-binding domain
VAIVESCKPNDKFDLNTGLPCTVQPKPPRASDFVFTKDLKLGMTHAEVKLLQEYLNSHGYIVAKSGPGSKGKETTKFGGATKSALIRFQKANKITPAVGYFGPVSREILKINIK